MTATEISKLASRGTTPSDEMTCPERCLFYELRDIYKQHRDGTITLKEGENRKQKALRRFERDSYEFTQGKDILRLHGEMWRKIEATANAYRKDPTIEHADAFLEAVYGCGRKEKARDS